MCIRDRGCDRAKNRLQVYHPTLKFGVRGGMLVGKIKFLLQYSRQGRLPMQTRIRAQIERFKYPFRSSGLGPTRGMSAECRSRVRGPGPLQLWVCAGEGLVTGRCAHAGWQGCPIAIPQCDTRYTSAIPQCDTSLLLGSLIKLGASGLWTAYGAMTGIGPIAMPTPPAG